MDRFLKSTLRLFLSVDVVGSTAFKQNAPRGERTEGGALPAEPWFSPIAQFYRQIERLFSTQWEHICTSAKGSGWPSGQAPEFWKGAGDELIYTKELGDHREALTCLLAWMRALSIYRVDFKKQYPNLDLKSTAWIAGFPVHNAEVFFRSAISNKSFHSDDDYLFSNMELMSLYYSEPRDDTIVRDFIGPSIDTGFRLATLATPRKLIVSIDLALILVNAARIKPHNFERISFHYDGKEVLKGVFGGAPYPIFWIDMESSNELYIAEDKISQKEEINSDLVKEYCEHFINQNQAYIFIPYIVGNHDATFGGIPFRHEERLKRLQEYWEKESEKRRGESESVLAKDDKVETKSAEVDEFIENFGKISGVAQMDTILSQDS